MLFNIHLYFAVKCHIINALLVKIKNTDWIKSILMRDISIYIIMIFRNAIFYIFCHICRNKDQKVPVKLDDS